MRDDDLLRTVATAITDGEPVDWTAAYAAARSDEEKALLSELQAVSKVTTRGRLETVPDKPACSVGHWFLSYVVLPAAAVKIALGGIGWSVSLTARAAEPLPPWPYICNLVVFASLGAVLVLGSRADLRARYLGTLFLLIAVAFSDRLLLGVARYDELDRLVMILRAVPMDAFIAFALWSFVWSFPAPPLGVRDQRVTSTMVWISFSVGVVLVAANVVLSLERSLFDLHGVAAVAATFGRQPAQESYYVLAVYGLALPTLPYLLWKSRFEALEKRRRITLFTAALVGGLAPMMVVVLISTFVDYLQAPSRWPWAGALLYLSLLSVAPLTAYAVLAHRIIDVQLLLTKAMQHALVRQVVWVTSLVPLAYVLVYICLHRDLTVADIVAKEQFILLSPVPLLSVLAFTFRKPLLLAIDRLILDARPDYPTILARLQRDLREALGVQDVAAIITREVERAVHPRMAVMLIIDETGQLLIPPMDGVRALNTESVLAKLLQLAREEVFAGVDACGPVGRLLPEEDRRWLTDHGFQLLMPLTASTGGLLGIIALGQKRSEIPFSADDRSLLRMMAGQAAVVLENQALRDQPFRYLGRVGRQHVHAIDWNDEPGTLCSSCLRMWPARHTQCECGATTASTALPLVIRGKFRVERLLGSGGMSLVYLAIDITLDRRVAIKTLPLVTHDHVLRLEREARAMAAVTLHPNLAMVFGTEHWRGIPLMVVEYLEGGTLADRLRHERLTMEEVIDLGIVLADVLGHVHAAGVLHRDIKPTNIGYTRAGVPKLLDFGVATIVHPAPSPVSSEDEGREQFPQPVAAAEGAGIVTSLTSAEHVVGTPLYLSPEALAGAEPDPSFDVWSLTVVLFEALTGRHPFDAPTRAETFAKIRHVRIPDIRDVCDECSGPLAAFFEDALAGDVSRRPRSAHALRSALQRMRATLGIE